MPPTDPPVITETELAEIERRVNAATSGEWRFLKNRHGTTGVIDAIGIRRIATIHVGEMRPQDAIPCGEFIAHSRDDVLRLTAALRASLSREQRLRDALGDLLAVAESFDWENAEVANARAALDGGGEGCDSR